MFFLVSKCLRVLMFLWGVFRFLSKCLEGLGGCVAMLLSFFWCKSLDQPIQEILVPVPKHCAWQARAPWTCQNPGGIPRHQDCVFRRIHLVTMKTIMAYSINRRMSAVRHCNLIVTGRRPQAIWALKTAYLTRPSSFNYCFACCLRVFNV